MRASVGKKQTKEKLKLSYLCTVLCMVPSLNASTNVVVSRTTNNGAACWFQAPKTFKYCPMMVKTAVVENVPSDDALTKQLDYLKKEIFEVRSENKCLHALNMKLQEQLLHYMLKPGKKNWCYCIISQFIEGQSYSTSEKMRLLTKHL